MEQVPWWAWMGMGAVLTLFLVAICQAYCDMRERWWRIGRHLGD